jgi:hypothetical protein
LDEAYGLSWLSYRTAIAGAGRERRRAIAEEYRQILSPIARRIISEEILPRFRELSVEVFTVALSPNADRGLMESLAAATTRTPSEVHSFYAEKPTDLMDVFTQLLQYWTHMTVLHAAGGTIQPGMKSRLFLDEFVRDPHVLALLDGGGEFFVETGDGVAEQNETGVHPGLQSYLLSRGKPPGMWNHGFHTGQGAYRAIWVARNLLKLVVAGLKEKYRYGEVVEAQVALQTRERDAGISLAPETRIDAELIRLDQPSSTNHEALARKGDDFLLRFSPAASGVYTVRFTAYARDRQGQEMMPRPSLRYQFEVLPDLYVLPRHINFGKVREGTEVKQEVEVHSGLKDLREILVGGGVLHSSTSAFRKGNTGRLPRIQQVRFKAQPAHVTRQAVVLEIPEGAERGDYEGEIVFRSGPAETFNVGFRAHIPTLWERFGSILIVLLVFLLGLLCYLAYVWGCLGSPFGVLVPLRIPADVLLPPIQLSQVRRGFFSRWLNWKRHRLRMSGGSGEIALQHLPPGLQAGLYFYRWGRVYIRNQSAKDSGLSLFVELPDVDKYERGPGESLGLPDKSTIEIGPYTFRYETS